MRRVLALVLAAAVLLVCSGCERKAAVDVWAMDTYMNIQLWGREAQAGAEAVEQRILELENTWAATDGNSVIGRLNRGQSVTLTQEQSMLLQQVQQLSERTGGAFDPKLRALSFAWGFLDGAYQVPAEDTIAQAMQAQQWDLGAAVKGYAGQSAAQLLESMDVTHAILNLGGNVQTYGSKPDGTPWQIGIQDPAGGDYLGIVSVEGTMAVVTSGDYQRYFEQDGVRYHHILDPETGYPADSGLTSVTVICQDGLTADVLSTALFVMGLEEGTRFWRESEDFEAVFILQSGEIYATEGAALSGCQFEVISREE